METHPVRFRLPISYNTEIGRIIQQWALLEWRIRSIAYLLLDLDPKRGRVAVREVRITMYLTMIEDLSKLRSIKLDIDMKQLKKNLEKLAILRNAIAHGVWLKHSQTQKPVLQIVTGNYEPAPGQSVKARIDPQALEMDIENLKRIRTGIGFAIITIDKLKLEIDKKLST